ncbi:MAG: hypothetical protein [Bacteriophage sp.]|nr:MAG: hypothetical protein [Bacteriophage sp.]
MVTTSLSLSTIIGVKVINFNNKTLINKVKIPTKKWFFYGYIFVEFMGYKRLEYLRNPR